MVEGPAPELLDDVVTIGMDQFRKGGLGQVLEALPNDMPYYLSIDIDVVDPSFAPATGTPVPGGMYPHELKDFVAEVSAARQIIGCDIVEVAHSRGPGDQTAALAAETVLTIADGIVRNTSS